MKAQEFFVQLVNHHFGSVPLIGVEIGTASGIWTDHILQNVSIIELYTIDPYRHFRGQQYEAGWEQERHDHVKATADKRFNKPGYAKRLIRIYTTSEEAIEIFPTWVDFVYIDGNHGEEFIKRDVELYWPRVRPGGIFAGHDINLPQVRKALVEKFGDDWNEEKEPRVWWKIK